MPKKTNNKVMTLRILIVATIRPLKEKDKGSSHAKYSTLIALKNMVIHDISNDTNIIKDFLEHLRFE
jgi:hypothetical protein